jgi:hypothetical protein
LHATTKNINKKSQKYKLTGDLQKYPEMAKKYCNLEINHASFQKMRVLACCKPHYESLAFHAHLINGGYKKYPPYLEKNTHPIY